MKQPTVQQLLATAPTDGDTTTLARLRARLAADASDAGLLDIAYRHLDTPVGNLLLAATQNGLVRVAYAAEDHDRVLEELAERISARVLHAPARLDTAARELDDYFVGKRTGFDLPLDLRTVSGFRRHVLDTLRILPYGHTATYGTVAMRVGNPRAVRAVGTACAHNPLPVIIPCHRVIRGDGKIGNYLGGTDAKRALLELEGAVPA